MRSTSRNAYVGGGRQNRISVQIKSDIDEPIDFVAPAVSHQWLAGHVRLPYGGSALSARAKVKASCQAIAAGGSAEAWRGVPITVTLTLAGYAPVKFVRRIQDAPPEPIVLERD